MLGREFELGVGQTVADSVGPRLVENLLEHFHDLGHLLHRGVLGHVLRMVLVRLLEAVHGVIELLDLVLGLVDLRDAILLLRIVVDLLFFRGESPYHRSS